MKKKTMNILLLCVEIVLIAIGIIYFRDAELKKWNGIIIGLGAGLFSGTLSNLFMINWYKKHPKEKKQAEIDYKDERSELIRGKAKAMSGDITQWLIMGFAWIMILIDADLWIILALVGVFLSKSFIEFYLMGKYNKEL